MTHAEIFTRACKNLRNSTSARMLGASKKYYELFEAKCLTDGVNPQLVMEYAKIASIYYKEKQKQLK